MDWGRPKRGAAGLASILALAFLGALTSSAAAASLTTDCAGLQAALDQAQTGDTIMLNQLCTASNSGGSGGSFSLSNGPSDSRSYTLTGQPGSGAGFDGTGVGDRMLSATAGGSPTPTMTVSNLVFMNGASPGGGGAIAFQGDYTVTLSGDTFTSNQALGGSSGGAVDVETDASSAAVTLSNDSFASNLASGGGGGGGGGAGGAVNVVATSASATFTLDGDTFANNATAGGTSGGAVELLGGGAGGQLTVRNSSFRGNTAQLSGGGLDVFTDGLPVTMTRNVFANNSLDGCGSTCELDGGAVSILNFAAGAQVTQAQNTFTGNGISGGLGDVNGGGESVLDGTVNSTNDVFTGNSLQAPVSGHVAEGSALGIENDCGASNPQDVALNLAVAGNSIAGGGSPASANGALSISCAAGSGTSTSNRLELQDATISGNRGGGGTAGIWGEPGDQLTVQNSIVAGDSSGAELTGFGGTGGSVAASYSDLCNGASPFTGTGNICADPALAEASSGDVHETYSSPTVDAGSNALVPSTATTDVYGANRIQPRLAGRTAIVDMGAAEFPTIAAPSASITVPANGATYAVGQSVSSSFSCNDATGAPGISSCLDQDGHASGGTLNTSTLGAHTFTVSATSGDGLATTTSVAYTVAAATRPAPTVSTLTPAPGARYPFGQRVPARFSCQEATGGPGIASCLGTVKNGSPINTSAPGAHTFTVTATSSDGQITARSVRYTVLAPSNRLVIMQPNPHSDGTFIVTVRVMHPGAVDVLVTAWDDNVARLAAIEPAAVLLRPAPRRFVFARAHAIARRAGTMRITVRPNARGRLLVANHRYRVTLRLWVTYTPAGGSARSVGYYGLHLP
ncbi:MAG TPA: hypothetical protein VMP89_09240 [Solirubrobacteraceae bacterium]|nr:hypothetical protein [Solirubrobacteraceae bacterium]